MQLAAFVAVVVGRMQHAVCEFVLAGLLLVLCGFFAFLARFLYIPRQVCCKLLASRLPPEISSKFAAGVLYCVWCVALLADTII